MTKCEEMFYNKSQEVQFLIDKLYDLTNLIQFYLSDLQALKHEFGSYDSDIDDDLIDEQRETANERTKQVANAPCPDADSPVYMLDADLDEPDLNGKEEFDHAVEHGDTDRTLP